MVRLRRADCSRPGLRRTRSEDGFSYIDARGKLIADKETRARIDSLRIPPAWEQVWICPDERGHVQAVGTDAAGRRQYLYHPQWRLRRDAEKFSHMLSFARGLPALRERVDLLLQPRDVSYSCVLAAAVRLLDRGFFRLGGEGYAEEHQTYGLATLRKAHVRLEPPETMLFDYIGKHGKRRQLALSDPAAYEVVTQLKRRRGGGPELLAYRREGKWSDVRSGDLNAFIKKYIGESFSAKDFRTWNGTVLAAVSLAVAARTSSSATARSRAMANASREVAHYLGNTPAVARASYIDPRIFDSFRAGITVRAALGHLGEVPASGAPAMQGAVERAVLELLEEQEPDGPDTLAGGHDHAPVNAALLP